MDTQDSRQRMTPKDFFLHLGVVVGLYVTAISLLNLIFTVITVAFPNKGVEVYYASNSISIPVAILIVFFPLFLVISYFLNKEYSAVPEKRSFSIRKWLLYITLFVTGIAVAIDLSILIYYFLDGRDITTGFILKVLSVFVVSGLIFFYYTYDLKDKTSSKVNKLFAIISSILILSVILWGFSITGSPRTQRLLKIDQNRIYNLQNIQNEVVYFWQLKRRLPVNLSELNNPLRGFSLPNDPETGEPYKYSIKSSLIFDLCATFAKDSPKQGQDAMNIRYSEPYKVGLEGDVNFWNHGVGEKCFETTIDPELYPPIQSAKMI